MLISCFLLLDAVPSSTTAETTPASKPLVFTVTTEASSSAPVSTAPVASSSNLLLDSLKKMQGSQAAPVPAGEEERGQWDGIVAEQTQQQLCIPFGGGRLEDPCLNALLDLNLEEKLGGAANGPGVSL